MTPQLHDGRGEVGMPTTPQMDRLWAPDPQALGDLRSSNQEIDVNKATHGARRYAGAIDSLSM